MAETKLTNRKSNDRTAAINRNKWHEAFLKALSDIPNVSYACDKAKVSRITAYGHKKRHKRFSDAWESALQHGVESLEEAAMERAKKGVPHGVWMKDEQGQIKKVETVRDYSDTLLNLLLKAHKPEKYREPRQDFSLQTSTTNQSGEKTEFVVHVSQGELP